MSIRLFSTLKLVNSLVTTLKPQSNVPFIIQQYSDRT